ncbi:MAG: hypothetical protein NC299_06850 [Lachnospiraceae bacterium]|nr:hypothetical protein [Ruminococcus sp.]MCM1275072.1 hypothetical protein [Lachnospiraceae bacterium]
MNARFEFGENLFEIVDFKHYPEDAAGGNPYNTLFDLRVQSMDGRFAGVGDFECDIKQIVQFAAELKEMYDLKRTAVKLESLIGYEQELELIMQRTGQITVCGTITNFTHSMKFKFKADQTALPPFIKSLEEILRAYGK